MSRFNHVGELPMSSLRRGQVGGTSTRQSRLFFEAGSGRGCGGPSWLLVAVEMAMALIALPD